MKADQVKRSRLCLTKKRLDNHDRVKVEQNERQQRHREVRNREMRNKSDRLREFRIATKYNAVFICTCCQQRMFHSNVQLYNDKLKAEIDKIKMGFFLRFLIFISGINYKTFFVNFWSN